MKFFLNLHLKRSKRPSSASFPMIMPSPLRNPLLLGSELSAIHALSADGSTFGVEPSVICVFIADGWLCLHRTVHDIGL